MGILLNKLLTFTFSGEIVSLNLFKIDAICLLLVLSNPDKSTLPAPIPA